MSQLLDRLAALDPAGHEALLLCLIMAALLGVLIVLGFGLVTPPNRGRAAERKRGASSATDLDVLTLWRLSRLRRNADHAEPREMSAEDSVPTPP